MAIWGASTWIIRTLTLLYLFWHPSVLFYALNTDVTSMYRVFRYLSDKITDWHDTSEHTGFITHFALILFLLLGNSKVENRFLPKQWQGHSDVPCSSDSYFDVQISQLSTLYHLSQLLFESKTCPCGNPVWKGIGTPGQGGGAEGKREWECQSLWNKLKTVEKGTVFFLLPQYDYTYHWDVFRGHI